MPEDPKLPKGPVSRDRFRVLTGRKTGRLLFLRFPRRAISALKAHPYFQRVVKEGGAGSSLRLLAILPQPTGEARQYLSSEGVRVDDVRQVPLESIGVSGTPTLLLVDGAGIVTDLWVGKVPPEEEDQVLAILHKNQLAVTN